MVRGSGVAGGQKISNSIIKSKLSGVLEGDKGYRRKENVEQGKEDQECVGQLGAALRR